MEKLEKDFMKWSGYPLEGNNAEELKGCIKTVLWNLEGELNHQADSFEKRVIDRIHKYEGDSNAKKAY